MTFPKVQQISLGYQPGEDRLALIARTRDHGRQLGWITRRLLRDLLSQLRTAMTRSHPAADRSVAAGEMLQLEHMAAMSEAVEQPSGEQTGAADREDFVEVQTTVQGQYLITRCHIRPASNGLIVAMQGRLRNPAGPEGERVEPVMALVMDRRQVHQLLELLRDQAGRARWDLQDEVAWMEESDWSGATRH